ncbi:MAG: hypothetical protein ACTHQM_02325, partial [Thermoanaerobaculia bacterium]
MTCLFLFNVERRRHRRLARRRHRRRQSVDAGAAPAIQPTMASALHRSARSAAPSDEVVVEDV